MNKLVFLTGGKLPESYTRSDLIAEYTGNQHHTITKLIRTYENDLKTFGKVGFEIQSLPDRKPEVYGFKIHKPSQGNSKRFPHLKCENPIPKNKGGRPEKVYHLNEPQATLLITYLKNTEPVREFKKELVRQFYAMRERIQELTSPIWQETRSIGKEIRRKETDCIKTFVEYAAAQGSKHADRYYINLSKLADNAAGIDNRERATVLQLNALLMAETMIEREIKRGISCGNPYPSIYSACKERLGSFREILQAT